MEQFFNNLGFDPSLDAFRNLDLLSVGITIAAIGILGFLIFFSNRKSATNRAFLFFSLITIIWGVINYLNYQVASALYALWLLRLLIFLGVWHAFSFFQLCYVFPGERAVFSKFYTRLLLPLVLLVACVTLSPFAIARLSQFSKVGHVSVVEWAPGMLVFVLLVFSLIIGGIVLLVKKMRRAQGVEKTQLRFMLGGTILTFLCIITFNIFLPVFYEIVRFIPLGAAFILPFIGFTYYAIARHHLFNTKVISTEILSFVLAVTSLFEVILAEDILTIVLRSGIFLLILSFCILLIRSVRKEVEQREELQKLSDDLRQANAKLEDLSRFKTQLLSLASHQIKSPLAAIKGFAEILIEGIYGPVSDKVKETLVKMKKSADGLVGLINTLLDVRKVEEGKMQYEFTRVDFGKLVGDKVEELRQLAVEKNITLEFLPPAESVWVNADAQKLAQVIQNLVDNSIKYTPAGSVKITLATQGDSALLTVADTGLGIPADLLPHLFEEFIREERVKSEILGTGLGLFIARKIVEAHSGKIWAESEGKDKGSRFFVALRKA
jgi:signal transduction histidine kinase